LVGGNFGTIQQSNSSATVIGPNPVGGLAGINLGSITQSFASGTITGSGVYPAVGGLVGNNSGLIQESFATGAVSGTGNSAGPIASVGGLVGGNLDGPVMQSYALGSVIGNGPSWAGGLVGINGYFGAGNMGTITQSYSAGSVQGASAVGGLVSYNYNGTAASSYWDTEASGQSTSGAGIGLTTAQLQSGILPAGFDTAVWGQVASVNNGFPCLLGITPGCLGPAPAC
jgi:hypothetical protein